MDDERRRWSRDKVKEPDLGMICNVDPHDHKQCPQARPPLFVGVHNVSPGGMLVEMNHFFEVDHRLDFTCLDDSHRQWHASAGRVAWIKRTVDRKGYLCGIEFVHDARPDEPQGPALTLLPDIDFLLNTKLLKYIPKRAVWLLLNSLSPVSFAAGSSIITQGDPGDSMYIVQDGTCVVLVAKDGQKHVVARLGQGEVVGEMAVLTGEPRYADVEADGDVRLWKLGKKQFERLAEQYADLRMFLTDLVTHRLETTVYIADRQIGKYTIKFRLGFGAWSIVYHGLHQVLNMPVAIKMLKHQMAMDHDFYERFMNEAKIIAKMTHRNIIQIFDIEEKFKTLFIVMEYLEGESLEHLLSRVGTLSSDVAIDYLAQMCAGLAFAHQKGIVHQDIKPANVMVLANDLVKIIDFGLACQQGCADLELEGTVYYMAPEQIEGDPVDARTDIYSLGITAYEMVCGKRPYPENDLSELMDLHIMEDIPDPSALAPDLPAELRQFILKACMRDPAKRFQSMDEALNLLLPSARKGTADDRLAAQRMTSLFLFFHDEHRAELNSLLEEFSEKAKAQGVIVKAAEFKDIA